MKEQEETTTEISSAEDGFDQNDHYKRVQPSWLTVGKSFPVGQTSLSIHPRKHKPQGQLCTRNSRTESDLAQPGRHVFIPRHKGFRKTAQQNVSNHPQDVESDRTRAKIKKGGMKAPDGIHDGVRGIRTTFKQKRIEICSHWSSCSRTTHRGLLTDKDTLRTLGHFDTEGGLDQKGRTHKPVLSTFQRDDYRKYQIVGSGSKDLSRYFKIRRRERKNHRFSENHKEEVPQLHDILSPKRVSELVIQCREDPGSIEAWLELGSYDSEVSYRLPKAERLERRLGFLAEGMNHCRGNPKLICEIMSIQESRYSETEVWNMWESLLSATVSQSLGRNINYSKLHRIVIKSLTPIVRGIITTWRWRQPQIPLDDCELNLNILFVQTNGSEVILETPQEDQVNTHCPKLLQIKTTVQGNARLIYAALKFIRGSFSLFNTSLFANYFERFVRSFISPINFLHPVPQQKKKISRFDVSPEQLISSSATPCYEVPQGLDEIQTSMIHELAIVTMVTLLSSSQWNRVITIMGLLGHADFILMRQMSLLGSIEPVQDSSNQMYRELKTFLDGHTIPLGHYSAVVFYKALAQSELFPHNSDVELALGCFARIGEILQSETSFVQPTFDVRPKSSLSNEAYSLQTPIWFAIEDELEDSHFSATGFDNRTTSDKIEGQDVITKPSIFQKNPHSLEKLPYDFTDLETHVRSLLIHEVWCPVRSPNSVAPPPAQQLLCFLFFPFSLAACPPKYFSHCSGEFISTIDFLEAIFYGLRRRRLFEPEVTDLMAFPCFTQPSRLSTLSLPPGSKAPKSVEPTESSRLAPIPLNTVFGFDVTMTTKSELFPFMSMLMELSKLEPLDLIAPINKLRQMLFNQQLPSLRFACMVALQLLMQHPTDSLLTHSVVGTLTYIGLPKLARRLLKARESNPLLWVTYATFSYASTPDLQTHRLVRSVLTKFATSSNLVTVEFIVGWIKLECLARIQQMQTSTEGAACQESHSPALLSSCVLPSICHLLCCFTEGTFQTWESSCNEQDIKVESSASVSGWDFWCLPSVPRMKCALGVLNRDLYSLALEPLTDYYLLSPGSFLSTVLLSSILLAVVESPESAWEKFRSSLPPKDHNKWGQISHSVQMSLDVLLLIVLSSSPTPSSSKWSLQLVHSLCMFTLDLFPSHRRAMDLMSQFYYQRSTLLKLRASLSPTSKNEHQFTTGYIKGILLSEFSSGFPLFHRIENLFEMHLTSPSYRTIRSCSSVWIFYLAFLSICIIFKGRLLTGLPSTRCNQSIDQVLCAKLRAVSQRARVNCPWSKRLWMMSLAILSHPIITAEKNRTTEEDQEFHHHSTECFLSEVKLLMEKGITARLDPLEILT